MNKQEEIREVIDKYVDDDCLYPKTDCTHMPNKIFEYCNVSDEAYKCLTKRLTKIGVVIKVDRELPDNKAWHKVEREFEAYSAGKMELLGAGYTAVEPLI